MLERALPRSAAADPVAGRCWSISLLVLVAGLQLGWRHVNSGWLFASSSLRLPLDLVGGTSVKIKLAWMYLSLWTGMLLLTVVNVELILRSLVVADRGHAAAAAACRPAGGGVGC